MTMRIAELRMRSAPMIGPTVRTLRGSPSPNSASRSSSRFANSVPPAIGAGVGSADGLGAALAEADALGSPLALALALAPAEADADGASEPDGAGSSPPGGMRSIGS